MPLYSSKIIKSELAERSVSEYKVKKIEHGIPQQIHPSNQFTAEFTGQAGSFRMDELLKERTGLSEKRQQEIMTEVESKVIEKLSEVQEEAYRKAYDLGLEEGKEEGLRQAEQRVFEQLSQLEQMLAELQQVRTELIRRNEAGLVDLAFQLGSRIAMRNIQEDRAYIFDLVREITDSMQVDTELNLRVGVVDFEFIEEFKDRDLRNKELFRKIKMFKEESLQQGECILESNYGMVNAGLQQRVEKLWERLSEAFPKQVAMESLREREPSLDSKDSSLIEAFPEETPDSAAVVAMAEEDLGRELQEQEDKQESQEDE